MGIIEVFIATFPSLVAVNPKGIPVSRTIRRMPTGYQYGKNHGKWYIPNYTNTKPDYAGIRIHHTHPGGWWSGLLVTIMKHDIDPSFYEIERYENGRFSVIVKKTFSIKDTYTDVEEAFERQIIEYARKNGTCKRQRRHGVRLSKKIDRRQRRAALKAALMKELDMIEQDMPDPAPRWTVSQKRKAKTLLRAKSRYEKQKYKRALEKSSALTFYDLYVKDQYYWD